MPEPVEDTKTSVPDSSEADAQIVQDTILGKETKPSEPAEEKKGEAGEKVEEKEKPKAGEKAEAKPDGEAKVPDADEEAKIAEFLSRFKGDSEAVKRQIAKAYREKEKQFGERDTEVSDLRKENLEYKQFKTDLDSDPEGTIKWLSERAKKIKEESSESLIDKALDDPGVLEKHIDDKIADYEDRKNWVAQQEVLMEGRYEGWKDRTPQRTALRQAIQLGKFPYPEETLDLMVRGAAKDKVFADAKTAVKKEQEEALAQKMEEQVQIQAGGAREEKQPSNSQVVTNEILTEAEKARR